jgi:hypothetical protein
VKDYVALTLGPRLPPFAAVDAGFLGVDLAFADDDAGLDAGFSAAFELGLDSSVLADLVAPRVATPASEPERFRAERMEKNSGREFACLTGYVV